jgi:excisionase family DNA binding protein
MDYENIAGVLTVPEAARLLRCSKAHLHHIISGKVLGLPPLPVLRIGRRVLIRCESLLSWMEWLEGREAEMQRGSGSFRRGGNLDRASGM